MDKATADIRLEDSWKRLLTPEFALPYMQDLKAFLLAEKRAGKEIYPRGPEWFRALDLTPYDCVKVVILGQDPYHGPGQAHGLCFSVRPGVPLPPSLLNIYRERESDLGMSPVAHGHLVEWARRGVLLLNSVLTVERHRAASHRGRGWETFTDAIIHRLNDRQDGLVFILWGSYAQKKGAFIDRSRHLVLSAPHPSPLSAHRGFFGSRPFSRTNEWLEKRGFPPVDWRLSETPPPDDAGGP